MTTPRLLVARWIAEQEMRLVNGQPAIYQLPGNDGGGSYEVAGFNDKYHPVLARELAALVREGEFAEVWRRTTEEIADYTDAITRWGIAMTPGEEAYLRDCAFNRGPTGSLKIVQLALLIDVDGKIGPQTRQAFAAISGNPEFLRSLRLAREVYEYRVAGYRSNLWLGLTRRWNNALKYAQTL